MPVSRGQLGPFQVETQSDGLGLQVVQAFVPFPLQPVPHVVGCDRHALAVRESLDSMPFAIQSFDLDGSTVASAFTLVLTSTFLVLSKSATLPKRMLASSPMVSYPSAMDFIFPPFSIRKSKALKEKGHAAL